MTESKKTIWRHPLAKEDAHRWKERKEQLKAYIWSSSDGCHWDQRGYAHCQEQEKDSTKKLRPMVTSVKTGAGNSLHVASQMTRKCSIRMYPWLNVLAVFRLTILNPTETLILHACSRVDRATQSMTLTNEAQYSIGYRDFVVKTLLSFSTTWGWEEFRNIINDFNRAVWLT